MSAALVLPDRVSPARTTRPPERSRGGQGGNDGEGSAGKGNCLPHGVGSVEDLHSRSAMFENLRPAGMWPPGPTRAHRGLRGRRGTAVRQVEGATPSVVPWRPKWASNQRRAAGDRARLLGAEIIYPRLYVQCLAISKRLFIRIILYCVLCTL